MNFKLMVLCILFINMITCISAQENNFSKRFNINVGYGIRFNKSNDNYFNENRGLTGFIEPEYILLNNQTLGIKAEYSYLGNNSTDKIKNSVSLFNAAYYLTSNIFFTKRNNNPLRIYSGWGVGLNYLTDWVSLNTGNNEKIGTDTKFGVLLRTGFYYRFLNINLEYKYIPQTYYNSGNYYNSYFSINLSASIHSRKNIQIGNYAVPAQIKHLDYFIPFDTSQNKNYAAIYIIRTQKMFASLLHYKILINDNTEQIVNNNSGYEIRIWKDTTVSLQTEYSKNINPPLMIHVLKGKKYYIEIKSKMGFVAAYPKLLLLDNYEGQYRWNKLLHKF